MKKWRVWETRADADEILPDPKHVVYYNAVY